MATTTNFGWSTPDDTDLVKDGALAIRTLGSAIDTSLVDLKGGTTGQVLSKTSNTDMDFTWVTSDDADAIQNSIVDAKGDLIAASADNTPARLAVGSNGDTLVADSAASTGLRWQGVNQVNYIINGGMDIFQRGTSIAGSTSAYVADRWRGYRNTTGSTFSRQTSGLTGITQYGLRAQRNSGDSATNGISVIYTAESQDTYRLAGQTVILSFYAKAGANYSSASSALAVALVTGTGTDQSYGSFTGSATAFSGTATLTTSYQRFSFTGSLSSSATQFALDIGFTPVGTASTNDWFEITGVQVELGSVATPFKRAGGTLQGEIALAQRYYYRLTPGNNCILSTGNSLNTTQSIIFIPFPVTMRTRPTALEQTGTAANYKTLRSSGAGFDDCTAVPTYDGATSASLGVIIATSANVVQGEVAMLFSNNSTAYLGWSAEL